MFGPSVVGKHQTWVERRAGNRSAVLTRSSSAKQIPRISRQSPCVHMRQWICCCKSATDDSFGAVISVCNVKRSESSSGTRNCKLHRSARVSLFGQCLFEIQCRSVYGADWRYKSVKVLQSTCACYPVLPRHPYVYTVQINNEQCTKKLQYTPLFPGCHEHHDYWLLSYR